MVLKLQCELKSCRHYFHYSLEHRADDDLHISELQESEVFPLVSSLSQWGFLIGITEQKMTTVNRKGTILLILPRMVHNK